MNTLALVLSCEHAVNTIPTEYRRAFEPWQSLLHTHEAIDFGALEIATGIQETLGCELIQAKSSRLLIDCNRSLSHPTCFSKVSKEFELEVKERLVDEQYLPFRQAVIEAIQKQLEAKYQVLHLSIHSFTPKLQGQVRQAEFGLLYDPKRAHEKSFATLWQAELKDLAPEYRVRKNYPYQGISDGFTTALRKLFSNEDYLGLELETNQALVNTPLPLVKKILVLSLVRAMASFQDIVG